MLSTILIKLMTWFMPVIIAFNGFVMPVNFFADNVTVTYDFANSQAGSAAGTVTLDAKTNGTYELYWGDEDYERLSVTVADYTVYYSEFAEIKVEDNTGSADIQEFTVIPEGAETVIVFKCDILMGKYDIPEEKKNNFGEEVYSFGALSDLHFNRYNGSLTGDDALITFPNALNFFEAVGAEMVGMSGDLSANGERESFEYFHDIVSGYDFPVYTCTGNHDVNDEFVPENWQELINSGVYGENKAAGVADVADNGLDFVYAPEGCEGDVFIFFSQVRWDYGESYSRLVTDEQLDWLEEQLEKYSDTTVFLFFHTFLNQEGDEPGMGEGNLVTNKGHTYDLPYTSGAADEVRFRGLMKEYKNVVFFNGHSHWAYDMQSINPQLNITDYNGEYATMVHVSSVTSPRRTSINSDDTSNEFMRSSEGMLVTVYEDKIVFTGIDFLRGEILAYANYVIEIR